MIQQMIYRRSEQGYRTVAASEMLVGKSLCRHIESLSTLAPSSGQKRLGVEPVYSRCAVEKGLAVLMTVVDPGGIRGSHITHAWYVPEQDVASFASGNAIPADKFIREYRETSRMDVLPCAMPKELCQEDTLSLGCSAAKALFGKNAELLAQFLTCVIGCGQPVADRGFLGVCALTDAEDASLNAYRLMETVLRAYAQQQVATVGYRSMWNRAEDNVRYPVFFTTPDLIGSEASVPMNYVLFDLRTGAVRLPRGMKLTCDAHSQSLARTLLSGNATDIRTLQREAEEEFARIERQKAEKRTRIEWERREAESFHVEPNVQYSFRPKFEPEQQNVEQQHTHEVVQRSRRETAPVRVEEQYSHREAAPVHTEEQYSHREAAPDRTEKQYSHREAASGRVEEQRNRHETASGCVEPKRSEVHPPLHSTVETEKRRTAPKAVQSTPVQTYSALDELLWNLDPNENIPRATVDRYLTDMARGDRGEDYLRCAEQLLKECVSVLENGSSRQYNLVARCAYKIAECALAPMAIHPEHLATGGCKKAIRQINRQMMAQNTLLRSQEKWVVYLNVLNGSNDVSKMERCVNALCFLKNQSVKTLKSLHDQLIELAGYMLEECARKSVSGSVQHALVCSAVLAVLYARMQFDRAGLPVWENEPLDSRLSNALRKINMTEQFNNKHRKINMTKQFNNELMDLIDELSYRPHP